MQLSNLLSIAAENQKRTLIPWITKAMSVEFTASPSDFCIRWVIVKSGLPRGGGVCENLEREDLPTLSNSPTKPQEKQPSLPKFDEAVFPSLKA